MPRGLTEPAHINKHPQRAHSSIRTTLRTLPAPHTSPSTHHCHIRKKAASYLGAHSSSQHPYLAHSSPKLRPTWLILDNSCHLSQEGKDMVRDAPWLPNPSLNAINCLCSSYTMFFMIHGFGRMKPAPLYQLLVPIIMGPFNTSCADLKEKKSVSLFLNLVICEMVPVMPQTYKQLTELSARQAGLWAQGGPPCVSAPIIAITFDTILCRSLLFGLLNSHSNSSFYPAVKVAFRSGEFQEEQIHGYVWQGPFALHLTLSQHC